MAEVPALTAPCQPSRLRVGWGKRAWASGAFVAAQRWFPCHVTTFCAAISPLSFYGS